MRSHSRRRPRTWLLLVVSAVLVAVSGCEVKTDVALTMNEDGSGTVALTVTLDQEAVAQAPNLGEQLRTDDLEEAGWTIDGPTAVDGGGQEIVATKRFAKADDAGRVVRELSGENGPFQDFTASRTSSFGQTSYRVDGTLDLSGGLNAFADAEVTQALGGLPYGRTEEQLQAAAGGDLSAAAPFSFTVDLPNGGGRTYQAELGDEPITIASRSDDRNLVPFLLAGLAVLLLLAAVWVFVDARRHPERRMKRRSERGTGKYVRRPYQVYDEVDESLPAGVGGPPVEITVRDGAEAPAALTEDADDTGTPAPAPTGGRRRRRRVGAASAAASTAGGRGQVTVPQSVRPDVATRRDALSRPTPRKVARPRSIGPRKTR